MNSLPFRRLALAALLILAFSLPFEWIIVHLGPLQLTSVELLLALTLLLIAGMVWQERSWQQEGWPHLPAGWLWLWLAIAVAVFVSAALAPEHRGNALQAALRTISGLALALAIAPFVRRRELVLVSLALVAGGTLSLTIGWLELIFNVRFAWLAPFRESTSSAGPFLRLTGSFSHANQAAMYLEGTLPLLVALLWTAGQRRRWRWVALGALALFIYLQATFLTYSRSSFSTVIVAAVLVAAWVWPRRPAPVRRLVLPWVGLAGITVLMLLGHVLFNPVVRLRLTSEQDNEWYNLTMEVPETLHMTAGEIITPTITLRNEGLLVWRSYGANPIRLGGIWFLPEDARSAGQDLELAESSRLEGEYQLAAEPRWPLDEPVAPGESTVVQVPLQAPLEPGTYRFQWDMVQENVVWFSEKNGRNRSSQVIVEEGSPEHLEFLAQSGDFAAYQTIVELPAPLPPIPPRSVLWRVAAAEFQEHLLLGIGLDNFRLTYGEALGEEVWNESVHTNSWYIEMLVSLGLLGSLPFFIWLVALLFDLARRLRRPDVTIWHMALAAAVISFCIHGLLDYFLLFNDTGLLYWLLIGLWVGLINVRQSSWSQVPEEDSRSDSIVPPAAGMRQA